MSGARTRALGVREVLAGENTGADLCVGLEGGFHPARIEGECITFLKGWAYVTDGIRGSFGASPSIEVPAAIVWSVVEGGRELAEVIDETAGEHDVRSRQGLGCPFAGSDSRSGKGFEVALVALSFSATVRCTI
jgi:non-canonical (house-cleaning) NTP pyrophosphatase